MLINKEESLIGKTVSIKLITGEEIIANCVNQDKLYSISVTRPLSLVIGSSKSDNQAQVAFTPWMLSIDHSQVITIELKKVLFFSKAGIDATKQYLDAIA